MGNFLDLQVFAARNCVLAVPRCDCHCTNSFYMALGDTYATTSLYVPHSQSPVLGCCDNYTLCGVGVHAQNNILQQIQARFVSFMVKAKELRKGKARYPTKGKEISCRRTQQVQPTKKMRELDLQNAHAVSGSSLCLY